MTKWSWSFKDLKWDSLEKIDFKDWQTLMFLLVIFINFLSLMVNSAAGNIWWVVIAVICIAANVWALENHYKDK